MNESVRILCVHEEVYGDILCEWILYCVSERFVYVDTLMACLDILEAHFIVLYN